VKFLAGNQLPVTLVRFLNSKGHSAQHVIDLQLDTADDRRIWNHVVANRLVLISKDEDFLHMANEAVSSGAFVWVRLGNCRKQILLHVFEPSLPDIILALEQGHHVIEVR
jgi:predicted nuclease of predicted toxin-antitoxin system